MPTKKADNDVERFARIDALMEEYRLNREDLVAYVKATQGRMRTGRERSRQHIAEARAAFERRRQAKKR